MFNTFSVDFRFLFLMKTFEPNLEMNSRFKLYFVLIKTFLARLQSFGRLTDRPQCVHSIQVYFNRLSQKIFDLKKIFSIFKINAII